MTPPEDMQALVSGICDSVKEDVADVVKLGIWRWGGGPGVPGWALKEPWVPVQSEEEGT